MATVYIAGGFYGDYKETIKRLLGGKHLLIDPEAEGDTPCVPGFYVGEDLASIDGCDIVLAVQTDYPYVYGMAAEIGFAVGLSFAYKRYSDGKYTMDVIYVCLTTRIDSFLSGLARATFTDLEAACNFINERYERYHCAEAT